MKNIYGFLAFALMLSAANVVMATPGEILNLIANHKEYLGATLILIIGLVGLVFGSMAFGEFKKQIKQ